LLLSVSLRYALRRLVDLLVVIVLVIILKESIAYLDVVANRMASGTGINLRIPYAGVSIGIAAFLFVYVGDLIDAALSAVTGQVLSQRELQEHRIHDLLTLPTDTGGSGTT
jgi:TRAP-type C4-dicarboxylate transport system permease small subunit